jgi:hypothetical protein
MPLIPVDLTDMPQELRVALREELSQGHCQAMAEAKVRQALIAEHYFKNPPVWNDAVGPMKMSIDPVLLNAIRMALGEEGYDDEAMEWVAKNFEGTQVKAVSPHARVGGRDAMREGFERAMGKGSGKRLAGGASCADGGNVTLHPTSSSIVGNSDSGSRAVKFRKVYAEN